MSAINIQLRRKGTLTLPRGLRQKYDLDENDVFTLEDLGDGSFLLIPQASNLARLGDRVAGLMAGQSVNVEEVLKEDGSDVDQNDGSYRDRDRDAYPGRPAGAG